MITATPQPALSHLLELPYLSVPGGNALVAPWMRQGDLGGMPMARSSWSLAVLADTFRRAHGRAPVVAVPQYICNQSLWPLRQTGAELVFYAVREDTLAPDWDACAVLGAVDLFMLVHYFGWPNQAAQARAFCDQRGAWLVEDAAHVLAPVAGIGEHGDAVLYSPHKLLAVPDGAVLVVRGALGAAEHQLVDALRAIGGAHPPTTTWRVKRLIQKTPLGAVLAQLRPGGQPSFLSDPQTAAMPREPAPSRGGCALIALADLAQVAAARATNTQALLAAVGGRAEWMPLLPMRNDVAPYRLVMRCATQGEACRLYDLLRAARLPVESWPDLPPEVGPGAARHLRQTVLLLPCQQDLEPHALAKAYRHALEAA